MLTDHEISAVEAAERAAEGAAGVQKALFRGDANKAVYWTGFAAGAAEAARLAAQESGNSYVAVTAARHAEESVIKAQGFIDDFGWPGDS